MISSEIRAVVTLGRSAEERQLQGGKVVLETTACCNGPKDRDGNRQSYWFRLKVWRRDQGQDYLADEFAALKKGDSILVVGDIQPENWTDKEGKKQERICINVRCIGPAYWPREAQAQAPKNQQESYADFGAPRQAAPAPRAAPPPMPDFAGGADDDIPF